MAQIVALEFRAVVLRFCIRLSQGVAAGKLNAQRCINGDFFFSSLPLTVGLRTFGPRAHVDTIKWPVIKFTTQKKTLSMTKERRGKKEKEIDTKSP